LLAQVVELLLVDLEVVEVSQFALVARERWRGGCFGGVSRIGCIRFAIFVTFVAHL
jgi:hypothetical protein